MNEILNFFKGALSQLSEANFPLLVIIDLSAFAAVFVIALAFSIFSPSVRAQAQSAFAYAVNLLTAITLAVFLSAFDIGKAVAASAVFWCAGYILLGALRLFKAKPRAGKGLAFHDERDGVQVRAQSRPPVPQQSASCAPSGVRLEHALSIADKLLLKNLGRGDRQELEKIKTSLTLLKVKGILSADEGENLNEMFNALLKLMAKYDL